MPRHCRLNYWFCSCIIFLSLLIGCTRYTYIATTSPDLLFPAEVYNSLFPNKKIIVYYDETLTNIFQQHTTIHYVVAPIHTNEQFLQTLEFTKPYSEKNHLQHIKHNMQLLSFSLPLIIIKKTHASPNTFLQNNISLSQLLTESLPHNSIEDLSSVTLGFYPIEDSFELLFESQKQYIEWMQQAKIYDNTITQYYKNRYGPVALINIILDENIIYKYLSSHAFFSLPLHIRQQFNVYFLNTDTNTIPIANPLYLGKIKESVHSSHFMSWIYTLDAQEKIIQLAQEYLNQDAPSFLDNHCSTSWQVNQTFIFNNDTWLWDNQPLFSHISSTHLDN